MNNLVIIINLTFQINVSQKFRATLAVLIPSNVARISLAFPSCSGL